MRRVGELRSECPRHEHVARHVCGPHLAQRTCEREQNRTPGERDHRARVTHDTARIHDERFRRLQCPRPPRVGGGPPRHAQSGAPRACSREIRFRRPPSGAAKRGFSTQRVENSLALATPRPKRCQRLLSRASRRRSILPAGPRLHHAGRLGLPSNPSARDPRCEAGHSTRSGGKLAAARLVQSEIAERCDALVLWTRNPAMRGRIPRKPWQEGACQMGAEAYQQRVRHRPLGTDRARPHARRSQPIQPRRNG